jgi:hypothetical protein
MVRTSSRSTRLARAAVVLFSAGLLAACGGGGGSGYSPVNQNSGTACDPDAQGLATARPTSGYPTTNGNVEIVASVNTDTLNRSYQSFDLYLIDNFGNRFTSGFLSPVSDTGGPHPFTNDYYYAATVSGGLPTSDTLAVYLNIPTSTCAAQFVGYIQT